MRALSAAIREKKFQPAYFLYGEDEYRKDDALRALLDAAVDPATRDFNLDQRKGADLDAETLASLLGMPPMMAERRVVVIRDASGLRKDARAALERYLASPAPDVLLVLTAGADDGRDPGLPNVEPVEIKPHTGAELPRWIVGRLERLGARITPGAVQLLQDAVGTDAGQLSIEMDKLASYSSGREIDEAAVTAVVGVRREETLARLLDAVGARDVRRALALLPGVMQQPKMTAVYVVMTLTTQTLALAIAHARGGRPNFYDILKSGSSNVAGRAWGEAAAAWSRNMPRWTPAQLDRALAALLQADFSLKSSRVSSEEQVLAVTILAMCGEATISSAA
jgi:DNA polymerase III subunit delta